MSIEPLAGCAFRANASHSAMIGSRFATMKSDSRIVVLRFDGKHHSGSLKGKKNVGALTSSVVRAIESEFPAFDVDLWG
jgi:hypothetical protein